MAQDVAPTRCCVSVNNREAVLVHKVPSSRSSLHSTLFQNFLRIHAAPLRDSGLSIGHHCFHFLRIIHRRVKAFCASWLCRSPADLRDRSRVRRIPKSLSRVDGRIDNFQLIWATGSGINIESIAARNPFPGIKYQSSGRLETCDDRIFMVLFVISGGPRVARIIDNNEHSTLGILNICAVFL